jgi:hypothetical protein
MTIRAAQKGRARGRSAQNKSSEQSRDVAKRNQSAGLSKTMSLETNALTSRWCLSPYCRAIVAKSSLMYVR